MNITRENVDKLNAVLKLVLTKEDYEDRVADVLKDYRKKTNIPGFRPGRIPFGMITKKYRKHVLIEEINKLVSESLSNYLIEEKLTILGEPIPHEDESKLIDFDNDSEFEFKFDIGIAPEIEVKISNKDKIPYYLIKVDDELIDKYADNYSKQFGEFSHVETIKEKDVLTVRIVQLNNNDEVLKSGIFVEKALMATEVIKDNDSKKTVLSAKKGDELIIDLKKAYPSDAEIAGLLKIKTEEAAKVSSNFKVTINEVQRFNKAELNQELFDKVYGYGNVKSIDEFRRKVSEEVARGLKHNSNYKFKLDVKNFLIKKFKKDLPINFLKRWLLMTHKEEITQKNIDNFTESLKWQLIKDAILKENNIEVNEQDIKAAVIDNARMQLSYDNNHDEHLKQLVRQTLDDKKEMRKLYEGKIEEKIIDFVKDTAKVDEKNITIEKFNKLLEDKK